MRAIAHDVYGPADVLTLRDVPTPIPGADEVLVRVRAASVNPADWHVLRGEPYLARLSGKGSGMGPRAPIGRIRGRDLAGVVDAVGSAVTDLQPGDEVYGESATGGAFAEQVAVPARTVARKPSNLTFEQAAAVPLAANTALQGLRDTAGLAAGQRLLVHGASGGVGTFAVQLARTFGAEVTGVCSTRNVELVRSLGAAHVIDYTQQDPFAGTERYDVVLVLAGTRWPRAMLQAVTPKGTLLLSSGEGGRWVGPMLPMAAGMAMSALVSQRVRAFIASQNRANLDLLRDHVDAGDVTPVIDRTYPLDAVPDAIRYVEQGHTRGKVVVTV